MQYLSRALEMGLLVLWCMCGGIHVLWHIYEGQTVTVGVGLCCDILFRQVFCLLLGQLTLELVEIFLSPSLILPWEHCDS